MSASPELRFQRQLIEAVKDLGGDGFKMSNRFTIGIPDLALQLPTWPTLLPEVKLIDLPVRPDTRISVDLTPRQREFILSWQRAGGCTGLLIAHRTPTGDWIMCTRKVHSNEMPTKQEFLDQCMIRNRGTPLTQILRAGLLTALLAPGLISVPSLHSCWRPQAA